MKYCPNCGSRIIIESRFCCECGRRLDSGKNKYIITIVALLLVFVCAGFAYFALFRNNNIVASNMMSLNSDVLETTGTEESVPKENVAFSDDPNAIAVASLSVVKLNCYDDEGTLICTGSGCILFEKDVIVTNYHVIEEFPHRIEVQTEKGYSFDIVGGVGADKEKDIAILYFSHRSAPVKMTPLNIGEKSLQKGEKVVAIGSPLGLMNTVSAGVFSGNSNESGSTMLQFTASISSGSSGGALFNDDGEIIGITSASYVAGQNLNLAIPIKRVVNLYEKTHLTRSALNTFYQTLPGYEYPKYDSWESYLEAFGTGK